MNERPDDDSQAIERHAELAALTEQITRRMHAGEAIDVEDYALRYPKLAGPMRRLLPTLRQLAQLGRATPPETTSRQLPSPSNDAAPHTPSTRKPNLGPRTLDIES
jgi:hypothetical protein